MTSWLSLFDEIKGKFSVSSQRLTCPQCLAQLAVSLRAELAPASDDTESEILQGQVVPFPQDTDKGP